MCVCVSIASEAGNDRIVLLCSYHQDGRTSKQNLEFGEGVGTEGVGNQVIISISEHYDSSLVFTEIAETLIKMEGKVETIDPQGPQGAPALPFSFNFEKHFKDFNKKT